MSNLSCSTVLHEKVQIPIRGLLLGILIDDTWYTRLFEALLNCCCFSTLLLLSCSPWNYSSWKTSTCSKYPAQMSLSCAFHSCLRQKRSRPHLSPLVYICCTSFYSRMYHIVFPTVSSTKAGSM